VTFPKYELPTNSLIAVTTGVSNKKAQLSLTNLRDAKACQKLLQLDVFRFISPNSISPNFKSPMRSVARYVYIWL